MAALFAGNRDYHGTHGEPDWDDAKGKWSIKSTARTWHDPVTAEHWVQHLDGRRPLGVVPIAQDSKCWWGCGDIDDYELEVLPLIAKIEALKYPLVPCRSKSGGLHLFLFLREPEEAGRVQAILRDLMASLGQATAEIFPKQSSLVHDRDQGNWMVMPYFGGDFEGKLQMQFGLKKTGSEMTLGEFLSAAEAARTTTAEVKVTRGGGPRKRGPGTKPHVPFSDGPPCLQYLAANKVPPGGRDAALFMMGLYYKRADPDNWRARVEEANYLYLSPPGDAQFVLDKIKSLEKKDYEYTCKTEPMRTHCNSPVCRGRDHGVGDSSSRPPMIGGITKYKSSPPLWAVDVEGARVRLTTQELQDYRLFCQVCLAKVNKMFAPMKVGDWAVVVARALEDLVEVDVPEELTERGQFIGPLTKYLTNRMRARKKEELVSGRPWQDVDGEWGYPGDYYLAIVHLMEFAAREKLRWEKPWVMDVLQQHLGAVHVPNKTIAGHCRNLWRVPGGQISNVVQLPLPSLKQEKI